MFTIDIYHVSEKMPPYDRKDENGGAYTLVALDMCFCEDDPCIKWHCMNSVWFWENYKHHGYRYWGLLPDAENFKEKS